MEDLIPISNLNDFIFCPISIYFHNLYGEVDNIIFQTTDQINGTMPTVQLKKDVTPAEKMCFRGYPYTLININFLARSIFWTQTNNC